MEDTLQELITDVILFRKYKHYNLNNIEQNISWIHCYPLCFACLCYWYMGFCTVQSLWHVIVGQKRQRVCSELTVWCRPCCRETERQAGCPLEQSDVAWCPGQMDASTALWWHCNHPCTLWNWPLHREICQHRHTRQTFLGLCSTLEWRMWFF